MNEKILFWRNFFKTDQIEELDYPKKIDLINYLFQNIDNPRLESVTYNYSKEEILSKALDIFKKEERHILPFEANLLDNLIPYLIDSSYSDKELITIINKVNDYNIKAFLITKIKDDLIKEEYLKQVSGKYNKITIITSFNDDSLKVKYLNQDIEEALKEKIILSLKDDSLKLKYLNLLSYSSYQISIISSLEDDLLKLPFLERKDFNQNEKFFIISSFKDDNLLLKYIPLMEGTSKKVRLALRLNNDQNKKEALKYFRNEKDRIEIIDSIEDFHLRNSLFPDYLKIKDLPFLEGRILTKNDIPSFKENMLPDMTFGVELEVSGRGGSSFITLRKNGELRDGWRAKIEDSVDGMEVTSPILKYTYNDINELYNMCDFLKKNDFITTEKCGGHIHVGAHTLDTLASFQMFYYLYLNVEKILYLSSNEMSTLPRKDVVEYARPVSPLIKKSLDNGRINLNNIHDLDTFIKQMQDLQRSDDEQPRYQGINLMNINNGKNTIEFRFPNGSLDPELIHSNIKLFGSLIKKAKELTTRQITKEEEKILNILGNDIDEREKFELFLSLIFEDPNDRLVYLDRYIINSYLDKRNSPLENTKFPSIKLR